MVANMIAGMGTHCVGMCGDIHVHVHVDACVHINSLPYILP